MAYAQHLGKQREHARETCGWGVRDLGKWTERGTEMGRDLVPNSQIFNNVNWWSLARLLTSPQPR